jgi:thioredoxin 1
MLKHCIAEYAPCPDEVLALAPQEVLYYSFYISLTTKTRLGYQTIPDMDYYCHLTDEHLLLEPLNSTAGDHIQQYSLSQIQSINVVRSLTFNSFAQILFNPGETTTPEELVLNVRVLPEQGRSNNSNRAEDFVLLATELLGQQVTELVASPIPPELQAALASDKLVLIDFWMPGCRPCFVLGKVLETLMKQYGDQITLVKIDVEENQALAMKYGVDCFPTVLLAKSGVVVDQLVGALPKSVVAQILEQYLQPAVVS